LNVAKSLDAGARDAGFVANPVQQYNSMYPDLDAVLGSAAPTRLQIGGPVKGAAGNLGKVGSTGRAAGQQQQQQVDRSGGDDESGEEEGDEEEEGGEGPSAEPDYRKQLFGAQPYKKPGVTMRTAEEVKRQYGRSGTEDRAAGAAARCVQ
jgi:hypothetical protein